jgi:hypothetical protein
LINFPPHSTQFLQVFQQAYNQITYETMILVSAVRACKGCTAIEEEEERCQNSPQNFVLKHSQVFFPLKVRERISYPPFVTNRFKLLIMDLYTIDRNYTIKVFWNKMDKLPQRRGRWSPILNTRCWQQTPRCKHITHSSACLCTSHACLALNHWLIKNGRDSWVDANKLEVWYKVWGGNN